MIEITMKFKKEESYCITSKSCDYCHELVLQMPVFKIRNDNCVVPENIHTSPTDGSSNYTPHPLRISIPEGSGITPQPPGIS